MLEQLDDLHSLDLAPTIVLAAAGDVLGEELDDCLEWAENPTAVAIARLKELARREARHEMDETDGVLDGTSSARHHDRMVALWDGFSEDVCDLFNLALDRLRGEGRFPEPEVSGEGEVTMATTTAAKRTTTAKPKARSKTAILVPAGVCIYCGTAIASGVEACPACGGRDRRATEKEPLPSSLGPLNGEVIPGGLAARDASREIPVDLVDPSPYQRRRQFDENALERLSASIIAVGLLQPIVVRPAGSRYELIAGERRLRASKIAGMTTIAASVRELSDSDAAQACAVENLDREDLNAIEEAETLKVLLDVGGLTQDELGHRIQRSQPWIANRLRLLELPDDWQARIISQEMPPTHARELLAWKHRPIVLKKAAKEVADAKSRDLPMPSVEHFRRGLRQIAVNSSKPISGWQCPFKVSKKDRDDLDLETIELPWGGTEERAWNISHWNKLAKAAKAKEKVADKAEAATPAATDKKKPDPPSEWSIRNRVTPWLAREVADRIKKTDRDSTLRLLLLMATGVIECAFTDFNSSHPLFQRRWDNRLEVGVKAWRALIEMTPAQLAGVTHELVAGELLSDELDEAAAETLVEILAALGGDPLAYPIEKADLDLYDVVLLREMAGQQIDAKASKADCVTCLLADRYPGWLPAEFASLLTPQKPKSSKRKAKPR